MKNTLSDIYRGPRLDREIAVSRVQWALKEELTELQREVLMAYYLQEKTIPQIAEERGVNRSTICRTLQRAEERLRRYLRY